MVWSRSIREKLPDFIGAAISLNYNRSVSEKSETYAVPGIAETFNELDRYGAFIIGSLYYVIVAVVLIFFIHKFVRKYLFPRLVNKRHAFVLILTVHTLVLVAASLLVLSRMGVDITMIARISLLVVIVVAAVIFAIAPYMPQLPFKLGDMVEISGVKGDIIAISPVFVRLQTYNGRTAFIPTTMVWARNVVNYNFTPTRRVELKLKISADYSIADAREKLIGIMNSDERILDDPAPLVRIAEAQADGIDMLGLCWVKNDDFLSARSDLYEKVVNATQSNSGLSLALERQHVVLSGEVAGR